MGVNCHITWGLIDLVMVINYNRNAGLALDADLTLLVVDTDFLVRMRSCSDPHLTRSTKLLKPISDAELLRLALKVECGVVQTRMGHGVLRPTPEVFVFFWMRGLRFS